MPIFEGDEWTKAEGDAFRAGLVNLALEQHAKAMAIHRVPQAIADAAIARCRRECSDTYMGEFMLAWMEGQREFPELADPAPALPAGKPRRTLDL
jgi:hypothetical protein